MAAVCGLRDRRFRKGAPAMWTVRDSLILMALGLLLMSAVLLRYLADQIAEWWRRRHPRRPERS
jgi:hypothetical protein